ncbi:polyprenyl synthetase family protein [Fodinicurvata fenggangensis]|uniref:polyprenyl synthetase family protein n=1 Tax=Fodinicurvata fenggangensis TaxID=1121830 RepID=UPI00047BFC37|nr:farnesyl diphosphate synthase [Fodinicurvata fenggangensis]
MQERLARTAERVEAELDCLLTVPQDARATLVEAMRYAVLGGGKRLRPFLLLESAGLFEVPEDRSLRAAAALEMVHGYSLVHDDLPAMDDSELRRGHLTVHRAFDEATAILAGDSLLTEAFGLLGGAATHPDATIRLKLVQDLSTAAGMNGMAGGQALDLAAEKARQPLDLDEIIALQARKTGALIIYACTAGADLGQADQNARTALAQYGEKLGLAFQIADDLLDYTGNQAETGKPVGRDAGRGKATFVDLLGADGAQEKAAELLEQAWESLDLFGAKADFLRAVTVFVLERKA